MAETPPPRVTFVDRNGDSLTVPAEVGSSVMQTAKSHRVPGIRGDCGGFMNCATCHVYVLDGSDLADLPPVSPQEDVMLDGTVSERLENSRLSCQLPITETTDLRVKLPDRQV